MSARQKIRRCGTVERISCRAGEFSPGKRKGCDFGYALAASSCEGASCMDARTVAALDVTAAFAAQTPTAPRRVSRFFRVWLPLGSPRGADHSAYFGLTNFTSSNLSAVDAMQVK